MQQKLRDLMTSEHLKSGQLAEMLGINPAGISHILAGRNKPGFDLLQKILRRFPRLNPDWLLLDEGPMYRTEVEAPRAEATRSEEPLVTTTPEQPASLFGAAAPIVPSPVTESQTPALPTDRRTGRIARVVIFYDDQTFESFTPNK